MEMVTIHLNQVDSTQNYAKSHRSQFDPQKVSSVWADQQTSGRGQFQRNWISPPGNLYVTFYFRLADQRTLHSITQVMAFSLLHVLSSFNPQLKWPNDIQIQGKKVAGILCETEWEKDHFDCFLGLGLNIHMTSQELEKIDQKAISLSQIDPGVESVEIFLKKIQRQFQKDLSLFIEKGFQPFQSYLNQKLAYKSQIIECIEGNHRHRGSCEAIGEEGELIFRLEDQKSKRIYSGQLQIGQNR